MKNIELNLDNISYISIADKGLGSITIIDKNNGEVYDFDLNDSVKLPTTFIKNQTNI
jgi:hypothetical protein